MTANNNLKVKIHAPDRSLQTKIGVANLDQILTPEVVSAAQNVIMASADSFFDEGLENLHDLEMAWNAARQVPAASKRFMATMIDAAFSLKSKMGLAGCDLIAALAKSLQLYCEENSAGNLSPKATQIMGWHIASLKQLLQNKMKGSGGVMGEAIMTELRKLEA